MKVKVRGYRESDKAALVTLLEQLLDYQASVDDRKRLRRMPGFGESFARRMLRKVAKKNGRIFVAEAGSEVVGVVIGIVVEQTKEDRLEHIPARFGETLELVVRDGHRGKGIGTTLLRRMEAYFSQKKCNIVGIGLLAANSNAYHLYGSLGYEDRAHYMTKELPIHRPPGPGWWTSLLGYRFAN